MCLLSICKKGNKLSNKKISNAWNRNSDGSGYAFIKDGKIEIRKYMDLKEFKESYNSDFMMYGMDSPFLIHFRFATHGKTDLTNVHPFKVNDNLVFGHNGTINSVDDDVKLSDTQVFNNVILKNLDNDFLDDKTIRILIENAISSSKLAFLHSSGRIDIINESAGHWSDDGKIWFSNDGYKKSNTIYVNAGYNYNSFGFGNLARAKKNDIHNIEYKKNNFVECDFCQVKTDRTYIKDGSNLCNMCIIDYENH